MRSGKLRLQHNNLSLLELFMSGRGMVKYHVKHQADPALFAPADQPFQIFHRSILRIDLPVIF